MFSTKSILILMSLVSVMLMVAKAMPTDVSENNNNDNTEDNLVELDDDQTSVSDIFPDREGFITGHRIPLELFPKETIKHLKGKRVTTDKENLYVESSNFRSEMSKPSDETEVEEIKEEAVHEEFISIEDTERSLPVAPLAFQPEGLGGEFDKAYFSTLDVFVHDF